jgi:hypothetical protein
MTSKVKLTPAQKRGLETIRKGGGVMTEEQIRAEAIYRVHARHVGCVPPSETKLAEECDRETLHVRSLARRLRAKAAA